MGRIRKALIISILMFGLVTLWADEVRSEDRSLPPWLLLEKGKDYFRNRDFSTSMNYLDYALEQGAIFPEAEYWIGRIYEEEGEALLAEAQYIKAYEQKKYLYIQDDYYEITYRLARLYLNQQKWDLYEDILLSLVQDEMGHDLDLIDKEHQLIRVLKEGGIDELLFLYRLDYRYSLQALRQLGQYYYKNENYRSALVYNLYSVISQFSHGASGLLEVYPQYQYPRSLEQLKDWDPVSLAEDLESRLQKHIVDFHFPRANLTQDFINQDKIIEDGLILLNDYNDPYLFSGLLYSLDKMNLRNGVYTFFQEQGFYSSLYYLACSLYGEGYENRAREIWEVLYRFEPAGIWSQKSREQLIKPNLKTDSLIF